MNSASVGSASSRKPAANLVIEVDHKFAGAHLSLWVDDRLTYAHRLDATNEKRLVVFHHVEGHELHSLQITSGKHTLRVQVTSTGTIATQSATLGGNFSSGKQSVLRVNFNKRGEMNLVLQQ
jgi:hypothetical protein